MQSDRISFYGDVLNNFIPNMQSKRNSDFYHDIFLKDELKDMSLSSNIMLII